MAQSDRYKKLHTRYEALTARATDGGSLVPDTAYATSVHSFRGTRLICK